MNPRPTHHAHGFTLVELLVALVIFALLATLGWQVYDQLVRTKEKTEQKVEELSSLQASYRQLQVDLLNIVPVWQPAQDNPDPALVLAAKNLSFTRTRPKDPRFDKAPALERVTYQFTENALIRSTSRSLGDGREQPLTATLLEGVSDVRFVALDPGEQTLWPALNNLAPIPQTQQAQGSPQNQSQLTQLPLGIELSFTFNELPIVWRFALPKNAPIIAAPTQSNNQGGNGNSQNGGQNSNGQNGGDSNSQNSSQPNQDDRDL